MAFMTSEEVARLGFASVGKDAKISDKASFYNCSRISLGDRVRIDDFCVLSAGEGGISIGHHVHIAVFSSLIGTEHISLGDYSGISSHVSIYSSSDDYSGRFMTNPTIPSAFTNVDSRPVTIGKHVIIGCGSVILPGATLEQGVAVGALSLVNQDCQSFGIYSGMPAKRIKERESRLLDIEHQLIKHNQLLLTERGSR